MDTTKIKQIVDEYFEKGFSGFPPKEKLSVYILDRVKHTCYSYVSKKFTEKEGASIVNYLIMRRISKAKELLRNEPPGMIYDLLGYSRLPSFSHQFKQYTSMSPMTYRKMQKAEDKRCLGCDFPIAQNEVYCGECVCEDDCGY